MAYNNVLPPYKLASAQDLSASFSSKSTNIQYVDRIALSVNVLSGTPTGTFYLEGRTSLSSSPTASAQGPASEWMRLGTGQSAPSAGQPIGWDVGQTGITELRISYVAVSGSGACDIWIAAKRS